HPNSTARKTSGSSCVRIGCQTGFSNPSTISSTTAATLGTHSSTNPGRLCPSRDATGQQSVTQSGDWYYINDIAIDIEARFGNSCQRKLPRRYALRGPGDVPTPLLAHNQKSKMKMPSTASAARADRKMPFNASFVVW